MKIAVLKDADARQGDNAEARVSASPDTVKGYVASGHAVSVVKGAQGLLPIFQMMITKRQEPQSQRPMAPRLSQLT